uniref:RNA polymerase-associated protein LEO1 n=1 Tax=Aceria tosichella TaxID=561515 RepID=A0A6G1SIZ3_9ACAR
MDGIDYEDDEEEQQQQQSDVEEDQEEHEEQEQQEQQPAEQIHETEQPVANPQLGRDIHYVKLPNFLSISTHEYDPLYYEDEIDDDEDRDYEGRAKLKLRVENTIRWRKTKDDGSGYESNTRFVTWSDGSMSLFLGAEMFDVNVKTTGESSQLFVRLGQAAGLQSQALFKTKLSIRPNSTESSTHRKLTLSLADRSQKTQKIRMLNNPGQDPEARLSELSKNEDDKMKATMRRETKQRRIQERSQTGGPNAAYLEDYDEEDDDGSISLSAIKRNTLSRQRDYSGEDEESEDVYSDDSDPEFGKERRVERKSKQVVEDSDDDDD